MNSMEPVNTAPVQKFIQQVQAAESGRAREVKLSIADARQLAICLAQLNARLYGYLEKFVAAHNSITDQDIEIKIDGAGW